MRAYLPHSIPIVRVRQRGNALFLILIAVALFAALSYAVTQTGRGGGTTSKEQTALYAAQIASVCSDIQQGVQRMILTGTAPDAIESNTPSGKFCGGCGTSNNLADFCTSGANCLFAPDGGGIPVPKVPAGAFASTYPAGWGVDTHFAGPGSYEGIEIDGLAPGSGQQSDCVVAGIGTNATDDVVQVFPLKQDVCLALDKGLGFTSIPDGNCTLAGMASVTGKEAACIHWPVENIYLYYQVLVPH